MHFLAKVGPSSPLLLQDFLFLLGTALYFILIGHGWLMVCLTKKNVNEGILIYSFSVTQLVGEFHSFQHRFISAFRENVLRYKIWDAYGRLLFNSAPLDHVVTSIARGSVCSCSVGESKRTMLATEAWSPTGSGWAEWIKATRNPPGQKKQTKTTRD